MFTDFNNRTREKEEKGLRTNPMVTKGESEEGVRLFPENYRNKRFLDCTVQSMLHHAPSDSECR